jgi:hypothetical protein
MLLSTDHARSQSHQFIYARVLSIYHLHWIRHSELCSTMDGVPMGTMVRKPRRPSSTEKLGLEVTRLFTVPTCHA